VCCTKRFDWSPYIVPIDDRRALVNGKRCDEFVKKEKGVYGTDL
jgi:hypothetical protein